RSPSSIVIAPSGLGYVADSLDNTISRVKIDNSSGALSEVLPRTTIAGSAPSSMVTDSSGGFLYVANQGSNDVESYSVGSDGSLTFASSASVASSPSGLVLSSSGNLLFVTVPNFSSTTISIFDVSSTGDLTPKTGASGSAGTNPFFFTIDPSGKYMYVGNEGSKSITEFTLNSDGTLTSTNTIQIGGVPRSVAFTK